MERTKLRKKDLILNVEEEFKKDIIAYDNSLMYAETDIPMPVSSYTVSGLKTISQAWKDVDISFPLKVKFISENGNKKVFSFIAAEADDGNAVVQITVYEPSYESFKPVLIVRERARTVEQDVINEIVKKGNYVFIVDYNAIETNTATVFPNSLSYGKYGQEGERLFKLSPDAKDTCNFLYAIIHRRALSFIKERYGFSETVITGIRSGTEIAMITAGMERKRITALACLCGAGYVEYGNLPRFPESPFISDINTLAYLAVMSGISYLRNYPHPVFIAVGSNDPYSNIDRLTDLKTLISGKFYVSIVHRAGNRIDAAAFKDYTDFLQYTFWKSDLPNAPETVIDINRDSTVYADIETKDSPKIARAELYYSYGNLDHISRTWNEANCETVGSGKFVAKLDFTKQFDSLFCYAKIFYVNGLTMTEPPKFTDLSDYRLRLKPAMESLILYGFNSEGNFHPMDGAAIALKNKIETYTVPSGAKGEICKTDAMTIFIGDKCATVSSDKLLQADVFSPGGDCYLTITVFSAEKQTEYRTTKYITASGDFTSFRFSTSDFKDEKFRPLPGWSCVSLLTIDTKNICVNKIIFI